MTTGGLYEASHMELEVRLIALVVGLVKLGVTIGLAEVVAM